MALEQPEQDKARQLAERARSLLGDARHSFLDESCSGDPSLRAEVDALLAAKDRALAVPGSGERALGDLEVGHQIGPYRLLELLGEGGFGSVYLAEQREPVRRRVALKVIKLGMDTRQVIARFEAERQALAMMAHSNIARVLDVGATETGRPYFVMELVRGVPITEYCETQRLGVAERLALFVPVCLALQHAHQKGIIHRDVKPSNVLVTVESGRAVPKVIDFGIAKATLQALTDKTLVTLQQQLIGTPTYMPPEQAELTGLDVDTRADIYALGVLLYELLTGTTPFDRDTLHEAGRTEMLRIIREVEPRLPSARVGRGDGDAAAEARRPPDADLARRLRGDLDWIVMMCLEKDRTRRYETASELAADVQRHLQDQPVLAGAPSAAYRLRKFVRRNRAGVLAAVLGLALLLVGVVGTTWGLLWALDERARADQSAGAEARARVSAQESEAAARLAAARATSEAQHAEEARAESQQRALELERVVALQEAQLHDIDPELLGLRMRDQLVSEVAERALHDGRSALEAAAVTAQLEALLQGANFTDLALGTVVEGVLDPTLAAVRDTFESQPLVRARMEQVLATLFLAMGQSDRAESPQRSALATRRAELGPEHELTLESLEQWGHLLNERGLRAEARDAFAQCWDARRRTLGPEHRASLSVACSLANVLRDLGMLDQALEQHERVLADRQRLFGDTDRDTLTSLAEVGSTLFDLGRLQEAQAFDRRALEGRRAVLGDHDPETLGSINNLGLLLGSLDDFEGALLLLRETYQAARSQFGDRHGGTLTAATNLGSVLRRMGRLDEAEQHFEQVLAVRTSLLGPLHTDTLGSLANLGALRFDQYRDGEAESLLERAWLGMRRSYGVQHHLTLDVAGNLCRVRMRLGRLLEAEPVLAEVAHVARRMQGGDGRRLERALSDIEGLQAALSQHFGTLTGPSDETLACLDAIVGLSNAAGRFVDAETLLREGLPMHEQAGAGVSAWLLAESRSLLGEASAGQLRWDEGEALMLEGFHALERSLPAAHDRGPLSRAARRLARSYQDRGNAEQAQAWLQRARDLEAPEG